MDFSPVDQIKQKLDIVEVIGEYIRLAKAGRNYKARCPFHSERTPSFMVSPERQIWHCFGCGAGGDIFAFVKQIEGVEFADALRILARKAGVVLKRQDPQVQSQRKRLYDICELATKFFEVQLAKSASAAKVRQYLKERGLKQETIKTWRLGWAPDEWHALAAFLLQRGYSEQEILNSGLAVKIEDAQNQKSKIKNQKSYDRFRSRIMFPIFDIQGQIVGFAGRIFGKSDDPPAGGVGKYINTPQTSLYDKSRILYGLNFAKTELRQKNSCVFVEGNLDVIMSHQAGVKNTVASSGTALTKEHLKIIRRYTDNLLFAFDTDLAGVAATQRSIDLALTQDFNIKITTLKDKDPADLIKKNPAEWLKVIEQTQSVRDFYFISIFARFNSQTPEGKREIKKMLLVVIRMIGSRTEQSEWLRELARRLNMAEKDLMLDLQKINLSPDFQPKTDIVVFSPENKSRPEALEERFLGLCLSHPQDWQTIPGVAEQDFQNEKLGQIFCALKKLEKDEVKDAIGCLQKTLSPELKMQVEYLSLKIQQQPEDEMRIFSEIETCIKELKVIKIRQQLTVLSFEIEQAQRAGTKAQLKELLEKFSQLSSELIEITKDIKIKKL